MAKPTMQVKGLRELGAALSRLDADIQTKVAVAATAAGAGVIKKRAKALAPVADEDYEVDGLKVQRGNLPKQIVSKRLPKAERTLTSEHIVTVRGKRKYGYASRIGALQEFGTVKMDPQPFMRPAFDGGKSEAVQAIKNRLEARIKKAQATGK